MSGRHSLEGACVLLVDDVTTTGATADEATRILLTAGASQVILAGTLVTFGLPLEGVILIIGVDELLDMARTTVNLVGNCLATVVMARWEGEFKPERPERAVEALD